MSADLWLTYGGDIEAFHLNITYNLSPMLYDAGWQWPDGRAWSMEYLEGLDAASIGEKAKHVLHNLEAEPDRYRDMNPSNGWGSYDDLLGDWRTFITAIERYPDSRIQTWF